MNLSYLIFIIKVHDFTVDEIEVVLEHLHVSDLASSTQILNSLSAGVDFSLAPKQYLDLDLGFNFGFEFANDKTCTTHFHPYTQVR